MKITTILGGWTTAFNSAILPLRNALGAAAWAVFSALAAELAGYFLHRLLHSERIAWLSRSHMEHHLEHYGPFQPMRPSPEYIDATTGRWAIANVGLEWILPSALVLSGFLAIFAALESRGPIASRSSRSRLVGPVLCSATSTIACTFAGFGWRRTTGLSDGSSQLGGPTIFITSPSTAKGKWIAISGSVFSFLIEFSGHFAPRGKPSTTPDSRMFGAATRSLGRNTSTPARLFKKGDPRRPRPAYIYATLTRFCPKTCCKHR